MVPEASAGASRDNHFDLLRLVFALFVLVGHSYRLARHSDGYAHFALAGHPVALDVSILALYGLIGFFAISGYLVCGSYLSTRNPWRYLWKRALRIVPGFLVVAAVCLAIVGPLGSDDAAAYFRDLDLKAVARALLALHLPRDIAHAFVHNKHHQINAPPWSLAVESVLYLVIALLGLAGALRRRWPVAAVWLGLAAFYVFLLRARPPWGSIPHFAQGTLQEVIPLYLVFVGAAVLRLLPALRSPLLVLACAVMAVVAHVSSFGYPCDYFVAPVLVIWLGELRVRLPHLRDDLSYGMYLNAWPIQQLLVAYFPIGSTALAVVTAILSAPLALLSWRFVERPALSLKEMRFRRPRVT